MSSASNVTKHNAKCKIDKKQSKPVKKGRRVKIGPLQSQVASSEDEILLLERQILESRENYNGIATLLSYCQNYVFERDQSIAAAVALCRVFCRLMATGTMHGSHDGSAGEAVIEKWLNERLNAYRKVLLGFLSTGDPGMQRTALTLAMRLLKDEAEQLQTFEERTWRNASFMAIVTSVANMKQTNPVRREFIEKFMKAFYDVRYFAFSCLSDIVTSNPGGEILDNIISIAGALGDPPKTEEEIDNFYIDHPPQPRQRVHQLRAQKARAQDLWLKILRSDLTMSQRKTILKMVPNQIAPCFTKVELLMDFLTDAFDIGGSTSLAALSGLFALIQMKNLDYPDFYVKLYSLLDPDIMHSRHRSRFFRLLDVFLSSTHLPTALIASFIKRFARLTLNAPPSGIIVVIPWIYNLLKSHPSCTFMIHRQAEQSSYVTEDGMQDPFNMSERDPMETAAINSSLWEIHTLQSHYHPNVAMMAKIISDQFTKESYSLEDFLDHSYSSLLGVELSKEIKKPPVVEYGIPKRILLQQTDPEQDSLVVKLWDFV